jgi:predicted nucleotide-binding protein (sugar kinase/HSP70/actin superfamily)
MSAPAVTRTMTTYIPHMSDHAYALAAVMRNMGMQAEVLPMSNEESMTIGLDLCKGRECLPCFLTTGDLIRRSRQPGFDPGNSVYLMPGSTGPCRFGQYRLLQREILSRFGLGAVTISSPMITNSYDGLGPDPEELRKRFWEGAVAVDILLKLLHEHRPYERERGAADAAYRTALDAAMGAIEKEGRFDALLRSFDLAADAFARVAVDRSVRRPVIAVVGEVFVRLNAFSNRDIVLQVEAAGGQVSLAGFAEWQYTCHWNEIESHRLHREHLGQLKALLTEAWMRRREHQLHARVAHLLHEPVEAKVAHTAANVRKYYEPALEGEEIPTLSRAIESAAQGASGILNVMPFSCMPGIIVSAMAPRVRRDLDWIPWLDVSFDGQETTNIRTRLEAFMHQVFQYQRPRRKADSAGGRTATAGRSGARR